MPKATILGWQQQPWLPQSPSTPNPKHMLEHIARLAALRALDLPDGIERQVHQNRLLKMAREGSHLTSADLAKFELSRREPVPNRSFDPDDPKR
jgi:hypothetical protein